MRRLYQNDAEALGRANVHRSLPTGKYPGGLQAPCGGPGAKWPHCAVLGAALQRLSRPPRRSGGTSAERPLSVLLLSASMNALPRDETGRLARAASFISVSTRKVGNGSYPGSLPSPDILVSTASTMASGSGSTPRMTWHPAVGHMAT